MAYLIQFEKFNRMNDHFVKFLFANPVNKELVIALINAVLAFFNCGQVQDVTFKDRESSAAHYSDKTCSVDVLVEDQDGSVYNIEFQVKTFIGFINRVLFYWSKEYIKLESGQDYDLLKKITSIVFAQYQFFNDKDKRYARSFHIVDDDSPDQQLSDKLHIVVIDVPKWNKNKPPKDKMTLLDMFIAFFSNSTKYETLQELAKENKIMEKLMKAQDAYRQNDAFLAGYKSAEDLERDAMSHDNAVKEATVRQMVQNMKRENFDIAMIKKITGLSEEAINACQA